MHDVRAAPDDQRQDELTGVLKHVAIAGGAVALLAVAGTAWPYSLGIGCLAVGNF